MMCSPFDLKDYLFGELNEAERLSVERHLLACVACQDEMAALNATRSAVMCLRDEEPPRRIAFVSDKVFEPRWWQKIFASGPQLGFASAAMLTLAIVFHALHTPAAVPQVPAPAPVPVATVDQRTIEAEVDKRVAASIEKASVEIEARQAEKLLHMVNTRLAQRDGMHEVQLKTIADYLERMYKRNGNIRRAAFEAGTDLQ